MIEDKLYDEQRAALIRSMNDAIKREVLSDSVLDSTGLWVSVEAISARFCLLSSAALKPHATLRLVESMEDMGWDFQGEVCDKLMFRKQR